MVAEGAQPALVCFVVGEGMVSTPAGHIDFWFTMGSTYSYLSMMRLVQLERLTGIKFRWRPFGSVRSLTLLDFPEPDSLGG